MANDKETGPTGDALAALHFGWSLAELRGRLRPCSPAGHGAGIPRVGHTLPLQDERSTGELELNVERVISALADSLALDPADPESEGGDTFGTEVRLQAKALIELRKVKEEERSPDGEAKAWDALADLFYRWDERIQDALSTDTSGRSQGYQVGRLLAEAYWALDPSPPDAVTETVDLRSWQFLFSQSRVNALERDLGTIADLWGPITAPAVAASFRAWAEATTKPSFRKSADAIGYLGRQVARWQEVLVLGRDPETMLKPYAALKSWRALLRTSRAFFLQVVLGVVGLGLAGWFTYLLTEASSTPTFKVISGFLALMGISAAGVTAKLKNTTQSVAVRLRRDLYTELVNSRSSRLEGSVDDQRCVEPMIGRPVMCSRTASLQGSAAEALHIQ